MSSRLTVMHRRECGLCDDMLEDLERLRAALAAQSSPLELPPVEVVDVDSDSELHRRYGLSVPVLLLDGTVVCRHRLDASELTRLLRGRSA
jgi:predicted thioredoxin/glutaredoxin